MPFTLDFETRKISEIPFADDLSGGEILLMVQAGKVVLCTTGSISAFIGVNNSSLKTPFNINDGQPARIDWLNDLIPGTNITYAQKHGVRNVRVEENDFVNGQWVPNTSPAYTFDTDADLNYTYLNLTPQVVQSEFIIL